MIGRNAKKSALGFGMFSLALMTIGSLLAGVRLSISFFRGIEAAVVFGLLAWAVCSAITDKTFLSSGDSKPPENDSKSRKTNLKI